MTPSARLRRWARVAPAALALARARVELCLLSEEEVLARLRRGGGAARAPGARDGPWLEQTAWALRGVARRLPWRTDCLVRVLAADRLVRRRGLTPLIGLQAGRSGGCFAAHVWLSCGGTDLTGGPLPGLAELFRTGQEREAT